MNRNFIELLEKFIVHKVDFLLVGGYAVGLHGYERYTKDLDIWIRQTQKNAKQVEKALYDFFGEMLIGAKELLEPNTVFQVGRAPLRVDILTAIKGITFKEARENRAIFEIADIRIPVISKADLLKNKSAVARDQDLLDCKKLKGSRKEQRGIRKGRNASEECNR